MQRYPELDEDTFLQIKGNDTAITSLRVDWGRTALGGGSSLLFHVDWEREADLFGNNTCLRDVILNVGGRWTELEWDSIVTPFVHVFARNRSIEKLSVRGGPLDAKTFRIMAPFFRENRILRWLSIWECDMSAESVRELAVALARCEGGSLQELFLWQNGVDDDSYDQLNLLTGHHGVPQLRKLHISGSYIGPDGCNGLGNLLLRPESKLEELNLELMGINDDGMAPLVDALVSNTSSKLKVLHIGGNNVACLGWLALSAVLNNPRSEIEDLDLKSSDIRESGAIAIANALNSNTSLVSLSFRNCESITAVGWQYLFSQLKTTTAPLASLELYGTGIDNPGIVGLGHALGSLKTLKMLRLGENDSVTPDGWHSFFTLAQTSQSTLEELDLGCNDIGSRAAAALLIALLYRHRVRKLEFDPYTIARDILGRFSVLLRGANSALETLTIATVSEGYMTDEVLSAFLDDLRRNTSLRTLQLGGGFVCSVTATGWNALANVLCDESSIQSVSDSNHTLRILCSDFHEKTLPDKLMSCLRLNRNDDNPCDVARKKTIQLHLNNGQANTEKLADIDWRVMPFLIAWVGRDEVGHALMYQHTRNLAPLFESQPCQPVAES